MRRLHHATVVDAAYGHACRVLIPRLEDAVAVCRGVAARQLHVLQPISAFLSAGTQGGRLRPVVTRVARARCRAAVPHPVFREVDRALVGVARLVARIPVAAARAVDKLLPETAVCRQCLELRHVGHPEALRGNLLQLLAADDVHLAIRGRVGYAVQAACSVIAQGGVLRVVCRRFCAQVAVQPVIASHQDDLVVVPARIGSSAVRAVLALPVVIIEHPRVIQVVGIRFLRAVRVGDDDAEGFLPIAVSIFGDVATFLQGQQVVGEGELLAGHASAAGTEACAPFPRRRCIAIPKEQFVRIILIYLYPPTASGILAINGQSERVDKLLEVGHWGMEALGAHLAPHGLGTDAVDGIIRVLSADEVPVIRISTSILGFSHFPRLRVPFILLYCQADRPELIGTEGRLLYDRDVGQDTPARDAHPCLAAFAGVVGQLGLEGDGGDGILVRAVVYTDLFLFGWKTVGVGEEHEPRLVFFFDIDVDRGVIVLDGGVNRHRKFYFRSLFLRAGDIQRVALHAHLRHAVAGHVVALRVDVFYIYSCVLRPGDGALQPLQRMAVADAVHVGDGHLVVVVGAHVQRTVLCLEVSVVVVGDGRLPLFLVHTLDEQEQLGVLSVVCGLVPGGGGVLGICL